MQRFRFTTGVAGLLVLLAGTAKASGSESRFVRVTGEEGERFAVLVGLEGSGPLGVAHVGRLRGAVELLKLEVPLPDDGALAVTWHQWTERGGLASLAGPQPPGAAGGRDLARPAHVQVAGAPAPAPAPASDQAPAVWTLPEGAIGVLVQVRDEEAACATVEPRTSAPVEISSPGFTQDPGYGVCLPASEAWVDLGLPPDEGTILLRGSVSDPRAIAELEARPGVLRVWFDEVIVPLDGGDAREIQKQPSPPSGPSGGGAPPPGGGSSSTTMPVYACQDIPSKYDAADAIALSDIGGVNATGAGITVAMVDSGLSAAVPNVSSSGWTWDVSNPVGTKSSLGEHGNMTSAAVRLAARDATLMDFRILRNVLDGSYVSDAISAYAAMMALHTGSGVPQVANNSWAIFQKKDAPGYVTDPSHPLNVIIASAVAQGIVVVFAAGNCGAPEPIPGPCGSNVGPGNSIWGSNGSPSVITVGATDVTGIPFCYTSQGPAALDPGKPDVAAPTFYLNFYYTPTSKLPVVSGTSGASALTSGMVALLLELYPGTLPAKMKAALIAGAFDGPWIPGFDDRTGNGIIHLSTSDTWLQNN